MKISTTRKLWIAIHIIFLVTFNIVFFLLKGTDNPASVWISYGAIHLAYIMVWCIRFFRLREASLFGISSVIIMQGYCWLQFIVGILFIVAAPEDWKFAFIVQLIMFSICMIMFLLATIAGKHARDGKPMLDELMADAMKTDYVKLTKTSLDILQRSTLDMELKNQVTDVIDIFNTDLPSEKNTKKLQDLATAFSSAIGGKNQEAIEKAKTDFVSYIRN